MKAKDALNNVSQGAMSLWERASSATQGFVSRARGDSNSGPAVRPPPSRRPGYGSEDLRRDMEASQSGSSPPSYDATPRYKRGSRSGSGTDEFVSWGEEEDSGRDADADKKEEPSDSKAERRGEGGSEGGRAMSSVSIAAGIRLSAILGLYGNVHG